MMHCRPLMANNLTWDIGLGQDALFWEDSLDGIPAPDSANLPINMKNTLSTFWRRVSDYKVKTNDNQYGGWQWKPLEDATL